MKTLGRVKQYISKVMTLQLYKTLIIPDNDAMSAANTNKLQIMQNKCLHICTNSRHRIPIDELHEQAGLLHLSMRREAHTCNLVYKGINNLSSKGINSMFHGPLPRENNNPRSIDNMQLVVPRSRIKVSDGSIRVRGGCYYNNLPTETKTKLSFESFKEAIKLNKGIKLKIKIASGISSCPLVIY